MIFTAPRALTAIALLCTGLASAGCTGSAADALNVAGHPASAYPNINVVPRGEVGQMSPEQEIAMLTALNAELSGRATLTPAEAAAFEQRRRRLAELAATNEAAVEKEIEGR